MDENTAKKMINMISNMNEDELKKNLEKVAKILGNTSSEELLKKLKDNNIRK